MHTGKTCEIEGYAIIEYENLFRYGRFSFYESIPARTVQYLFYQQIPPLHEITPEEICWHVTFALQYNA